MTDSKRDIREQQADSMAEDLGAIVVDYSAKLESIAHLYATAEGRESADPFDIPREVY